MDTSRYQNGSIYKLCCKDTTITDIYVGSTCNFTKRKWSHKNACNHEKQNAHNYYIYQFIRDHGGWDNWEMIELIKYQCNTKRELELKEREYLELHGGTLKKTIPTRSKEESSKIYRKKYKKEINEKMKARYQANKEKKNEYDKAYREANKKEINERNKEKYTCDCGSTLRKVDKARHLKSLKHQKFLNEIKE